MHIGSPSPCNHSLGEHNDSQIEQYIKYSRTPYENYHMNLIFVNDMETLYSNTNKQLIRIVDRPLRPLPVLT